MNGRRGGRNSLLTGLTSVVVVSTYLISNNTLITVGLIRSFCSPGVGDYIPNNIS